MLELEGHDVATAESAAGSRSRAPAAGPGRPHPRHADGRTGRPRVSPAAAGRRSLPGRAGRHRHGRLLPEGRGPRRARARSARRSDTSRSGWTTSPPWRRRSSTPRPNRTPLDDHARKDGTHGPHPRRAARPRRRPPRRRHGAVGGPHRRPRRAARRRMGCAVVDKGDLADADSGDAGASAIRRRNTSARSRASARSSTSRSTSRTKRRAAGRPRRRSLAGGRIGRRVGGLRGRARRRDRPALGRRARRHEHAGDDARAATCTACRSRRCSGRSRPSSRRSACGRRRCARTRPCSSASATSTTLEKEQIRDAQGARLHDEGHRPARHRGGHEARARDRRQGHGRAFTSRSTWTSAIRRSRPASARRSKAASTTAKRTWSMEMIADSGRLHGARPRRDQSDSRHRRIRRRFSARSWRCRRWGCGSSDRRSSSKLEVRSSKYRSHASVRTSNFWLLTSNLRYDLRRGPLAQW